jgi:yecA family protein
MKRKESYSGRFGRPAPVLLPPNLQALGTLVFAGQEFAALDAWLAEDGWPPDRMDVAMLEGYLVALIVWPIELAPGAWLPPIWGIRGWKVAAKIANPESYDRFIALVVGMFQELERRLTTSPPAPSFVLSAQAPYVSGQYFAGAAWATGFMTALHEHSAGLGSRSLAVRTAVEAIARYASLRTIKSAKLPMVAAALNAALLTLLSERPARGAGAFAFLKRSTAIAPTGIHGRP